jgi:hypothetical protein
VLAQGYLLRGAPADGGPPLVQPTGIPVDQVDGLAARLLDGSPSGPCAVVVDVVSAARAARPAGCPCTRRGQQGLLDERRLFAAYASHAAAAASTCSPRSEDSRRDGARSARCCRWRTASRA